MKKEKSYGQRMTVMLVSKYPIPEAYISAVKFIVNHDLYQYFSNGHTHHIRELRRLSEEFKKWNIYITDEPSLMLAVSEQVFRKIQELQNGAFEFEVLENINKTLEILRDMGVVPEVWKSQNLYFSLLKQFKKGDLIIDDDETREEFLRLGNSLKVRMK